MALFHICLKVLTEVEGNGIATLTELREHRTSLFQIAWETGINVCSDSAWETNPL